MSRAPVPEVTYPADLQRQVTLLDLVDRIIDKGAVVRGQVVLTVADVDLVKLDLNLLLASVETLAGVKR